MARLRVSEPARLGAEGGTHCPTMSTSHNSMRMAPAHQKSRRMRESLVLFWQRSEREERAEESTESASALEFATWTALTLWGGEGCQC